MINIAQSEAKDSDRSKKKIISGIVMACYMGALGGIPCGALFSHFMQIWLKNSSPVIQYGCFFLPIVILAIIGYVYGLRTYVMDTTLRCKKCGKAIMKPMTDVDQIYCLPVTREQKYNDPIHFLARSMKPVQDLSDIPAMNRGTRSCVYQCEQCRYRIIRITDFEVINNQCDEVKTYYFDYNDFINAGI